MKRFKINQPMHAIANMELRSNLPLAPLSSSLRNCVISTLPSGNRRLIDPKQAGKPTVSRGPVIINTHTSAELKVDKPAA